MTKALSFFKLHPEARLPTRSHSLDAGLDLYALEASTIHEGETVKVRTGIGVDMRGHAPCVGLIKDRSSLAARGLRVSGGVVDAGYLGELVVLLSSERGLHNLGPGTRVAQLVVMPTLQLEPKLMAAPAAAPDLDSRGSKGFGSSGEK